MVNEMRKWINLINEIENYEIKYFGKVSPADKKMSGTKWEKWLFG
jgi:hypothetical protein